VLSVRSYRRSDHLPHRPGRSRPVVRGV